MAERALEIVRECTDRRDPTLDRVRLEAIADELANLVRLAAKVGHLDAHAQVLRELEAEKAELEARLATTPEPIDLRALRRAIDVMVGDLRAMLGNPVVGKCSSACSAASGCASEPMPSAASPSRASSPGSWGRILHRLRKGAAFQW